MHVDTVLSPFIPYVYLTIRLWAQDFYAVIVDEVADRHLIVHH